MRQVVVIAGPPCSGKTTRAHALADQHGGLVLDRDEIARTLGSTRRWMHSKAISRAAELAMRAELVRIAGMAEVRAYVVRSAPLAAQRAQLQAQLQAELVLLDPGRDECIRRARADHRPPGTLPAIHRWYARHEADQPAARPDVAHFDTSRAW